MTPIIYKQVTPCCCMHIYYNKPTWNRKLAICQVQLLTKSMELFPLTSVDNQWTYIILLQTTLNCSKTYRNAPVFQHSIVHNIQSYCLLLYFYINHAVWIWISSLPPQVCWFISGSFYITWITSYMENKF